MASSPIDKKIIDCVLRHSEKHFGRVDTLLKDMLTLLSSTPAWTEKHDLVFNEMLRSARTSRWQGIGGAVVAGMVIIMLGVYAGVIVPERQRDLAERLQNAHLAIELEELGSDLFVKYVIDPAEPGRDALLKSANLYDVAIGRYPGGLGTTSVLGFDRSQQKNAIAWRWNVTPQIRDTIIGTLTVYNMHGDVDRDSVYFGKSIRHNRLPEFHLMIHSVNPAKWVDEDHERSGQYEVSFGVVPDGETGLVWSASIPVRYSGGGKVAEGPFVVSAPGWPSIYVASVAIGYWGEGEHGRVAYGVRSNAYRVSFNQ